MQVVRRSLHVLRLLATARQGLSLAEIAGQLDLPMASAHRVTALLLEEGFVSRSPTNKRFFLGPAAHELSHAAASHQSYAAPAHPAVAEAARSSGETVFVSGMSGNRVVCLSIVESAHPLRLFVRVGQTTPLHAAASARVLLAWREDDEVRRLLSEQPLAAFTDDTPSDVASVIERLARIRVRGYDICKSELDADVWAVAAPVRSSTGVVVASLTIAAPRVRALAPGRPEELTALAVRTADAMAADHGWAAPDPGARGSASRPVGRR